MSWPLGPEGRTEGVGRGFSRNLFSRENLAALPSPPDRAARKQGGRGRAALEKREIWDNLVGVAALATIRVECPPFTPVKEYGGSAYHNRMYDTRTDLGNTSERDGDGATYCGRGFIQITGRANYERYGRLLGVNLLQHPDCALVPAIAAGIFAAYFQTRKVHWAAYKRDWLPASAGRSGL